MRRSRLRKQCSTRATQDSASQEVRDRSMLFDANDSPASWRTVYKR